MVTSLRSAGNFDQPLAVHMLVLAVPSQSTVDQSDWTAAAFFTAASRSSSVYAVKMASYAVVVSGASTPVMLLASRRPLRPS